MKCLHWAIVSVLFWMAWVMLRLSTASDIQAGALVWWWIGLPIGFALPAVFGWNMAKYTFYKKVHHIGIRKALEEESCD